MAARSPHNRDPQFVSTLLAQVRDGSSSAFDALVPLVYEELHELARAQRRRWRGDETLDTTALLHEAYLKVAAADSPDWQSRSHFFSVAARAMRQVLIDYARAKATEKRGGDRVQVSLDRLGPGGLTSTVDQKADGNEALLALDRALTRLERQDPRQCRVVECRFFGGMTIRETAAAVEMSTATVERDWAMAKAWLFREVQRELANQATTDG